MKPSVEVLPLSPLQEGLLYHALLDAGGGDVYTVQWTLRLAGRVPADVVPPGPGPAAAARLAWAELDLSERPAELGPWLETTAAAGST
jgi:hypothetical protein